VKRHPALQGLSDDHHRALVLARRIRRAANRANEAELAALAREVAQRFEAELEPHFSVEERRLFPLLSARGESQLTLRAVEDHTELRRLVRATWSRASALRIGELLDQHIRFEERVLFPRAEKLLSDAELGGVPEDQSRSPSASG